MQSHERLRAELDSPEWSAIEGALDHLKGGTADVVGLGDYLATRLPQLALHENWRIRQRVARLLGDLDLREPLLDRLAADPDHRVAAAARESARHHVTRAKERASASRKERRFEVRLAALRSTHGSAVADEVQAMAFELLSNIADRVGHDLLGMVTTLRRIEEILREHLDPESVGDGDWRRSVGSLPAVSQYLQSFAQDFRELLRAPAARSLVDVRDLVRTAVEDAERSTAPTVRPQVVQQVGSALRAEVAPGDLARCVANLTKNALEASASTVEIRAWNLGTTLLIRVVDNGRGMSTAMLARCFEPFQTSKETSSGKPAGLGLAIVRRKVELMGGRVQVESEVGKGTTFILEVPGVAVE